jgi:hypothetical protein
MRNRLCIPSSAYNLNKEVPVQLAFHGATSMPCDLETDVRVMALAGFKALELWAASGAA